MGPTTSEPKVASILQAGRANVNWMSHAITSVNQSHQFMNQFTNSYILFKCILNKIPHSNDQS